MSKILHQTKSCHKKIFTELTANQEADKKSKYKLIKRLITVPKQQYEAGVFGGKIPRFLTENEIIERFLKAFSDYYVVGDSLLPIYAREVRKTDTGNTDTRKFEQSATKLIIREGLGEALNLVDRKSKDMVHNRDHVKLLTLWTSFRMEETEKRVTSGYQRGMNFENLTIAALNNHGFEAQSTGRGADYGADVLFKFLGETYVGQCKALASNVGVKAIQEVIPALRHYGAFGAVVFSESGFTDAAEALALSNRVALVSGNDIKSLAKQLIVYADS